jgi:hypothetical protein
MPHEHARLRPVQRPTADAGHLDDGVEAEPRPSRPHGLDELGRYRSLWMSIIVHGIEGFVLILAVLVGWYPLSRHAWPGVNHGDTTSSRLELDRNEPIPKTILSGSAPPPSSQSSRTPAKRTILGQDDRPDAGALAPC